MDDRVATLRRLGYPDDRIAELTAPRPAARSESRHRTELVEVRLTPDEHAAAVALAEARGVTVPDLFRHLLTAVDSTSSVTGR